MFPPGRSVFSNPTPGLPRVAIVLVLLLEPLFHGCKTDDDSFTSRSFQVKFRGRMMLVTVVSSEPPGGGCRFCAAVVSPSSEIRIRQESKDAFSVRYGKGNAERWPLQNGHVLLFDATGNGPIELSHSWNLPLGTNESETFERIKKDITSMLNVSRTETGTIPTTNGSQI